MLKNTFCHVPGVGVKSECRLWDSGIYSWDTFVEKDPTSLSRNKTIKDVISKSLVHLGDNNPNYFAQLLQSNQHWRLFPDFRQSTAYLDIETTGLDKYEGQITTIAVYDGKTISYYVNGQNLVDFKEDIKKYNVIVTYNGKSFDVPFINAYFNIKMDHTNIDLRYILSSLGYRGGLKMCEKSLGIDRKELADIDGFFAVLLWEDYVKNKNEKALETLLAYNIQDVVNLETLMVLSYNKKLADTPFHSSHQLPLPTSPKVPFQADLKTIERIKDKHRWY